MSQNATSSRCLRSPHQDSQRQFRRLLQDAGRSSQNNDCVSSDIGNSTRCYASQGSPDPYLLMGLTGLFALVAFSLFVFAGCVEEENTGASNQNATSLQAEQEISPQDEAGTKIVVIMAGEDNPTFIAKPIAVLPVAVDDRIIQKELEENHPAPTRPLVLAGV